MSSLSVLLSKGEMCAASSQKIRAYRRRARFPEIEGDIVRDASWRGVRGSFVRFFYVDSSGRRYVKGATHYTTFEVSPRTHVRMREQYDASPESLYSPGTPITLVDDESREERAFLVLKCMAGTVNDIYRLTLALAEARQ